jgi:ABC-2 type transport system ATP-binding protein
VKVVREKIKMLNEKGSTIIFSSHILSEVENICDRVAIIDKGKMVAEDTITNISKLLDIRPQLVIMIRGLNGDVPGVVKTIEGIEEVEARGDELWITCDSSLRARMISVLEDDGLKIEDIRTIEPSLEDAFVRLVSERGGG